MSAAIRCEGLGKAYRQTPLVGILAQGSAITKELEGVGLQVLPASRPSSMAERLAPDASMSDRVRELAGYAARCDQGDAAAQYNLGVLYANAGQTDSAIVYFRLAQEKAARKASTAAFFWLGMRRW